jgi:nicotinamidase-related amidase
MNEISLILVDPQAGFCSRSGSLANYYGDKELTDIQETLSNLKQCLDEVARKHLVTSEYATAQFTDGNSQHPLANLCVPLVNLDCEIAAELEGIQFLSRHIKHEQSALSSIEFNSEIENDLESGVSHFVVTGFLFEHCVRATAQDLIAKVSGSSAHVSVCRDLSASRIEKYGNGEVEATIEKLLSLGVGYKSWQEIKP